jgi:hypothetical protein
MPSDAFDIDDVDFPEGVAITYDPFELKAGEVICTACWTVHVGECP